MKRLAPLCFLIVVFACGTAHAQQYEVAPTGTKAFTTAAGLAPGATIDLDIWLTAVDAPQIMGGVWIDFSASTDVISYVGGGAGVPCEHPDYRVTIQVIPPEGPPGTVMMTFFCPDGASTDGDGDILFAWF